jgi:hypothetical protein
MPAFLYSAANARHSSIDGPGPAVIRSHRHLSQSSVRAHEAAPLSPFASLPKVSVILLHDIENSFLCEFSTVLGK